jgi:proline iminopeptidase
MIPQRLPVVMVHGGPGVPDYLAPVAGLIGDLCPVHRYDQRGTGGSPWEGEHTIARHVRDLASLLDAWGHDRVVLAGHSFGTNMAGYFLLAHPERVAGLVQIAGPFLGPWREADQAAQRARRSSEQQARLEELDAIGSRTDAEEIEYLSLSWFTDHADQDRAWDWALASARTQRPVNYAMNAQLNSEKKAEPLESHVDELREHLPPGAVIIGGAGDTRPAAALAVPRDTPQLRGHHHPGCGARSVAGSTRPVPGSAPSGGGEADPDGQLTVPTVECVLYRAPAAFRLTPVAMRCGRSPGMARRAGSRG